MAYQIEFNERFNKSLKKLDKNTKTEIMNLVKKAADNELIGIDNKALNKPLKGLNRLKSKDSKINHLRVLYTLNKQNNTIRIYGVYPRNIIYKMKMAREIVKEVAKERLQKKQEKKKGRGMSF